MIFFFFWALTVISVIVPAYRWHRIATGNDKLVVSADIIRHFRASNIELYEVQSMKKSKAEQINVFIKFLK